jgi:hypothetical protein
MLIISSRCMRQSRGRDVLSRSCCVRTSGSYSCSAIKPNTSLGRSSNPFFLIPFMIRVGRVIVVTLYAYCVYLLSALYGVYSVEDDTWLALDKVLVPDIHMIISVGSFTLSEL